jgi:Spy/CpxP family protein refolding chaperone
MKNTFKLLSLLSLSAIALAPLARAEDAPAAPPAPPAGEHPHQGHGDRAAMRANRLKMLDEKLHLTDAQKQQITGIWAGAEQQGKALRDDDSLSKDDRRAKMGEIMKASHAQVRAILTPEQQTAFDAMPPPEMHGHRGPPKGDDAPPAPPKQ